MSISSSIYIGASGVMGQQTSMSVIADNISNMNTVGFKSSRLLFNNLISQQLTGAEMGNQIGQGVGVSSIWRDMRSGPLETTTETSDVAIGGHGFFIVSPQGQAETYYTKAGNFRFDVDGYYRDPRGNIVQGQRLSASGTSGVSLEDIRLVAQDGGHFISSPEATSRIDLSVNLNSGTEDYSTDAASPFTALFDTWDSSTTPPLDNNTFAYATALRVYDSEGTSHVLTAYFDPARTEVSTADGARIWEYLVTMPPDEDGSGLDTKKGVLLAGTLSFNPAGQLVNMTAFEGSSDHKSTWVPASLSAEGLPVLHGTTTTGATFTSALNFGLQHDSPGQGGTPWTLPTGVASMADLTTDAASLPNLGQVRYNALAATSYASSSHTIYQSQNGYGLGYLQSTYVDRDGVITGKFTNGQEQGLFKIGMADFINPQGLFRKGGNLFEASKDSGPAIMGWANEGRLGSIVGSTLENSNVDLATEFVNMIITQKAFDANAKVITTADQVVQTALSVKK